MSVAPVIIRKFAAVEVATGYDTFHLNRERLEYAIKLLSGVNSKSTLEVRSVVRGMFDKYPHIGPHQMYQYLYAAQACIDFNVTP